MADRPRPPDHHNCWQIWIDTGGTFTDCLALPPDGMDDADWPRQLRRAKVLSTGALRGRVIRCDGAKRVQVEENWGACDEFIAGMDLHRLDRDGPGIRIAKFLAADSLIELEAPLPDDLPESTALEVRGDEPAPILAARLVTATPAGAPLPPIRMRLATTLATNALLERRGAPLALFITQGFGDLLNIGDQQRPDLFALKIEKPPPLYRAVVEVRERLAVDGSVLVPLDADQVAALARPLLAQGIRVAAVALMHSHVNPAHERQVADLLRTIGFAHVSASSELAPLIRLLPRAQTAVVDAYLAPVIQDYLHAIDSRLLNDLPLWEGDQTGRAARLKPRGSRDSGLPRPTNTTPASLHVMTSAGGLVRAHAYQARDSLLSGPAGGVAGAAAAGRRSGFTKIIGFDMGGTSTDVARFDGDFEYRFEHTIAGVRLMAPALAIETVAAGGGSICDFVDERLIVGPRSAGAQPGPACYGAGGPLTLTDVNLLLGRLDEHRFEIPINRAPAETALEALRWRIPSANAKPQAAVEMLLQGFLDIADERMAAAIEQVSLRQGYDPRDYTLVAFGGAGGQHACAVADRLGIATILMPHDASLLSALGLGHAVIERFAQRQILQRLQHCQAHLPQWIEELARQAADDVAAEGVDPAQISVHRVIVNLRLFGQDSSLAVDLPASGFGPRAKAPGEPAALRMLFSEKYRAMYGHDIPAENEKPIEIESIRVVASSALRRRPGLADDTATRPAFDAPITRRVQACFDGRRMEVPACDRADLGVGARIAGPALVFDRRSSFVIEPGWRAEVDAAEALVLRKTALPSSSRRVDPDLARLELFSNRFAAIADDMGQILQRTATSTNVKERLDFSCAVLDANGELVVNAPHIPVHLGALGVCVRAVRQAIVMEEGDVIVTNHSAFGGSHLPDITVITPVFDDHATLLGYVANRAHHAEIGGTRPGSMPPAATTLVEEGVVIPPQHLLRRGRPRFDQIERVLRGGPYPSRAVTDNLADLRAAVAANHRGATSLRALAQQHGSEVVAQQMAAITDRAERLTRTALAQLCGGPYGAIERLDDGSPIQVAIVIADDGAVIDFAGSAGVHPGNLNATAAIVRSAVIYVLRLLIGARLPLNEGIMRAVQVRIPHSMLNPDFPADPANCPAVVGGNTETSQRIVDTLLKALGLCACSQGTMNNVLFGNERFGYYETVCGGSGAGPGFAGADAVHTHMTNTRITDPEIIEHRYPVRVERFTVHRGSGGAGEFRGGDGAVREITFLQPMSLSVLSQHRVEKPFGLHGGQPGAPGRQRLVRADGSTIQLQSIDGCEVLPGDRLILETPGGGGFGTPRPIAAPGAAR